jgi:hypothetical protein
MSEHDNPFSAGDQVVVIHHDWERGPEELRGEVVQILSQARCKVRLIGGTLTVSVPVEDMRLATAAEREAVLTAARAE